MCKVKKGWNEHEGGSPGDCVTSYSSDVLGTGFHNLFKMTRNVYITTMVHRRRGESGG